ncbi:MAG: Cell division trigger factor [uncultured Truepera sp.]|uniref:Trigger factor n=1 Tax=uncultured Truepera sp. TaxID=543023 RepID=A0A6J4VG19_9DEIN|nr:MAG: Cell division trigger factor [uncultured Truepera sp.]
MQTHILEQDAGRAKIRIDVPASDVAKTYQQVLASIARQLRVPGFRPGKAPRGVIETRVGKDAIAQEVRDAIVQTYFPRAVQELDLTPVAQHLHAHEPEDGQDYSFEAELELYPDFELPDLTQIVLDTEQEPVTDEMVQENVDALRSQNATLIPVERPAEAGDYLMVETVGAEGEEGSSIPVDLENVAPELAEQFLGHAIGDEIELTLSEDTEDVAQGDIEASFDAEADATEEGATEAGTGAETEPVVREAPEGAGEAAEPTTLRVVVRDIKAKERPEPDDEFAKTLGMETWPEVEAQLRGNLEARLAQEALSAQGDEFTEKLMIETTVTVPASLKARRKENMLQNLARELEGRSATLQGYLDSLDAEEGKREAFDRELDEAAEGAVKRDLVLERLLEVLGTKLSNEEFDAALAYTAQRQNTTPQGLRQELGESGLTNYRFLLTRDKAVRETVRDLLTTQSGDLQPRSVQEDDAATQTPVESEQH